MSVPRPGFACCLLATASAAEGCGACHTETACAVQEYSRLDHPTSRVCVTLCVCVCQGGCTDETVAALPQLKLEQLWKPSRSGFDTDVTLVTQLSLER